MSRLPLVLSTLLGCSLVGGSALAQVPPVPTGHPRVYVQPADLAEVQAKLALPQFADDWADVQASDHMVCRAFVYLVEGDTSAGQQAVADALVEISACTDARTFDTCMHHSGIVYDWCYDLLSPTERDTFITELERVAGSHGPGYPAELDRGAVVGHNTEGWLLTGQLPAGVAIYDESQTMYDAAAAVFIEEFVPARDYLYPAHMHHQGDSYVSARFQHDQAASWLFRRLGAGDVITREQRYVPYQLIYNLRPDRQQLRSGDTFDDRGRSNAKRRLFTLTGAYYEDPYLLEMAGFDHFWSASDIDQVLRLLFEPADAERRPIAELPLTKLFPLPMGEMVARTGWTLGVDSPDAVVNMRVGGTFFGNHQRKDFGTFQIYYRGPLAISSGVYEGDNSGYGTEHWRSYYHQTIAHNGLLIFDPAEEMLLHGNPQANDGGQAWPNNGSDHPRDLEMLLGDGYEIARVTAQQVGPDSQTPAHSYLAGDITGAYSAAKVSLVTRSMITLNTFDPTYPAVLVVFDRVSSTDASFDKSWLLHSIQEPVVQGRSISVIRDEPTYDAEGDYGGKLVVESLLPEAANIDKVGGAGREFWIESAQTNYATSKSGAAEPGAWRVEVHPDTAALDDLFLHVLTVMDATTADGPVVARLIGTQHEGVVVFDRVVLFAREAALQASADFDLSGSGTYQLLVCDLQPGDWRALRDGILVGGGSVTAEGTCLSFSGEPGAYHLEPGSADLDGGLADSSAAVDSSAQADAGAAADSSVVADTGARPDVAGTADGTSSPDGGEAIDAATGFDSSSETDVGAVDVSAGGDLASPTSDGSAATVDSAGEQPGEIGISSGCDCRATASPWTPALCLLALLLWRRRAA